MPEILDKVLSCALGGFYFSGKSGLFRALGVVLTGISTIFSDLFPDVASQRRSIMRMSPSEVRMMMVVMIFMLMPLWDLLGREDYSRRGAMSGVVISS